MEKVRTRIAMDLHDDIGSSLSQISILSEVARRDAAGSAASVQSLSRVAEISRDLVDALGDIVWAVSVTLIGYWFGSKIPNIDHYILLFIALATAATCGPMLWHLLVNKRFWITVGKKLGFTKR